MSKILSFLVAVFLLFTGLAAASNSTVLFWPEPRIPGTMEIYDISLKAGPSGTIAYTTPGGVYGYLSALVYITNGATKGTLTISLTRPYAITVDSYALVGGNTTKNLKSTTTGYMNLLAGPLTFSASGGTVTDANKTIEVWAVVER